jgi:hypothetical protein
VTGVEEIRRTSDGELCGHVVQRDDRWEALTVFGATIGHHDARDPAVEQVVNDGLAAMADRWTLRGRNADDQIVCIVEANAREVTVALGYYALPGVPTLRIEADQLAAREWELFR